MGPNTQTQGANCKISPATNLMLKIPDKARVLIISGDDSITRRLNHVLLEAGFASECANSITAGCKSASSGRFQVVISTPMLADGSWRRLIDIASHYDLSFVVVLVASTFDLNQWAEALEDGAFDVLDVLYELPKAAEATKRALWAAYLKGAGPSPQVANPPKAA
jgi:DNA-binding NtrC family response regulator